MSPILTKGRYKESTLKRYNRILNMIFKDLNIQDNGADLIENHPQQLYEYFMNLNMKDSTKLSYMKAVKALARQEDIDLTNLNPYINEMQNRKVLEYDLGKKKEYKNTYEDFTTILDKCVPSENADRKTRLKYMVVALYTLLPPLRGSEYYNTKLGDYEAEPGVNYYTNGILVLRDYKTSLKYGEKKIEFPDELANIVDEFQSNWNTTDWFLPNLTFTRRGNASDVREILHQMTKKYLNEPLSVNDLRKLFISWKLNSGISDDERIKISKIMGHSILVQEMRYNLHSGENQSDITQDIQSS